MNSNKVSPTGLPMKAFAAGGIASQFGSDYYLKSAVAGGICCSITHGALCPVDVVKTRIQLGSIAAADGLIGGMRKVVAAEGMGVLATGLGATAAGYFVQGFFKFGGFEFFKIQLADKVGPQSAWDNRNLIYLGASACAEFIADIFLCPLEAVRIRSVSDATFPKGLGAGAARMLQTDGVLGFYAGLGPILFKQIPYTMAKFAVQGKAAELMYDASGAGPEKSSASKKMGISLASGIVAGVVAAIISHPADTLLSKVNKAGAGGTGSTTTRLMNIAKEIGFVKLATVGLPARCVMIGTLTAGQFGIFDTVMDTVGASKYYFKDPSSAGSGH